MDWCAYDVKSLIVKSLWQPTFSAKSPSIFKPTALVTPNEVNLIYTVTWETLYLASYPGHARGLGTRLHSTGMILPAMPAIGIRMTILHYFMSEDKADVQQVKVFKILTAQNH